MPEWTRVGEDKVRAVQNGLHRRGATGKVPNVTGLRTLLYALCEIDALAMAESHIGRSGQSRPIPLTHLTEDECWKYLRMQTLGRLAVIVNGRPEIFPVNYRSGNRAVVIRTAPGAKLSSASRTKSCFEIDGWDDRTGTGWSVMVHGTITEITDAVDDRNASFRDLPVWPMAPGERKHWLALNAGEVTGRHFTSGPMAPAVL